MRLRAAASALERILDSPRFIMHVRDTWLLEDLHAFDEPADDPAAPELITLARRDRDEEESGFRGLLEDSEACSMAVCR